jgi:arsenate reductase
MTDHPRVLVACRRNAGRSVAARLLLAHYGAGRLLVTSAGSEPGTEVHPEVRAELTARGLDVSHEFPKPLTDDAVGQVDVVVTMGCGEECPFHPGKRYDDWPVADPAGQDADTVRTIVDDIDSRARALVSELLPGHVMPDAPSG